MGNQSKSLTRKAQGEETRATLIATGARLFALNGFHGVSMRTLAAEAGVNLATVGYHFGGKAGLYEAIMQNIIDRRKEIFPSAEAVQGRIDTAPSGRDGVIEVVTWFMDSLVRGILGADDHIWPVFIISRELAQPTELYGKLDSEFFQPSMKALLLVVGLALPDADDEEKAIVAYAIIGMITKFLEGHDVIIKKLNWQSYAGDGIEKIAHVMTKRTRGFLGLPTENE